MTMDGGSVLPSSFQTHLPIQALFHPQEASGNGSGRGNKACSSPPVPVTFGGNPDLRKSYPGVKFADSPQPSLGLKFFMARGHGDDTSAGQEWYALSRDGKPGRRRVEVDSAAGVRFADVLGDGLHPDAFSRDERGEDFDAVLLGPVPVCFRHDRDEAARLLAYQ